jgi:hypothetical protein
MVRTIFCILLISLLFFSSCGKQEFPNYHDDSILQNQENFGDQFFAGNFKPLSSKKVNVRSLIWLKGRQLYVRIIFKGQSDVQYQQFINAEADCPASGETLDDGHEMLVPLDRNLDSLQAGSGWFPSSNEEGEYYYSRSADINALVKDLRKQSVLAPNENLDLSNRTIVIYGSKTNPLAPVACAEINRN